VKSTGELAAIIADRLAVIRPADGRPSRRQGETMSGLYDFTLRDIDGKDVSLEKFRDQVILIVNVASKCGFTPQYEGLEALYRKYKDRAFVVLGFPANNFMRQEPGTNEEIKSFFPMFSKISVRGRDIHPFYDYLTNKKTNPRFGGKITWNFNKFLVSRSGEIIARFGSKDAPQAPKVVTAIEKALGEA
jgi:glutathione peroxidase-family protein